MNPAESKIKNALEKAAYYHRENGLSPNDSIIKAANEYELNPHMIDRVVESFNVAKTNAVLSRATDKTASFPVAERAVILDAVFGSGLGARPGESKTASAENESSFVEVPLSIGPTWGMGKTASNAVEHDVAKLIRDGVSGLMELDSDLSKFAQDALEAESAMAVCMRQIGDHFSLSDNRGKFAQFELDILSERGEEARPTLDVLHRHFCPSESRADWTPKLGTRAYQATAAHDGFSELIELTDEFIRKEAQLDNMRQDFAAKRASFDSSLREVSGILPPPEPTASDFLGVGDVAPSPIGKTGAQVFDGSAASFVSVPFSADKKLATGVSDNISDLASFGIDVAPVSAAAKGVNSALTKQVETGYERANQLDYELPNAHAANEMDNIRRSTILRELMASDDIISKANPGDVQRVYSTMLSLAPNVTLYPGVVQSILRSSLSQQAVDPFTAKQFADLESTTMKNKMLQKGKMPTPGT